jgi:hypothetical protein
MMSLKKQLNDGELHNFVTSTIKASYGETKVNNVDILYGDIMQGFDEDQHDGSSQGENDSAAKHLLTANAAPISKFAPNQQIRNSLSFNSTQ